MLTRTSLTSEERSWCARLEAARGHSKLKIQLLCGKMRGSKERCLRKRGNPLTGVALLETFWRKKDFRLRERPAR